LIQININIVFWDVTPCTLVDTSLFEANAFSVFRLPIATTVSHARHKQS